MYPLISVAESLKKTGEGSASTEFVYLGAAKDYHEVLIKNGIRPYSLIGGKIRRYASPLNILDSVKIFFSLFQALFKVFFLMPDAVFSCGGPGALVVVLAARFYRIPVLLLESNAIPGRTNIKSSKHAARIAIAFQSAAAYFKGNNVAFTGNPVRSAFFLESMTKATACEVFGLASNQPVLLVLGGSQGAETLNTFFLEHLQKLVKTVQILHQTGNVHFETVMREMEFITGSFSPEEKARYKPVAYFDDNMVAAFAAADLVVARSGANTVFEIAARGVPSLLVPLSHGVDQGANAKEYEDNGACVVLKEENLLPNLFLLEVNKILGDQELRVKMSEAAKTFSKPEAATTIANELVTLATSRHA